MRRMLFLILPAVAAAGVLGPLASITSAQDGNLLLNGDFDANTANWGVPALWSPRDSRGSVNSGSGQSINGSSNAGANVEFDLEQCVAVQPGGRYWLAADTFVPAGQQRTPHPAFAAFWFSQPGCPGLGRPGGAPVQFEAVTGARWTPVSTYITVPGDAPYAKIMLGAGRAAAKAGEPVASLAVVNYDRVRLVRVDQLTNRLVLPLAASD